MRPLLMHDDRKLLRFTWAFVYNTNLGSRVTPIVLICALRAACDTLPLLMHDDRKLVRFTWAFVYNMNLGSRVTPI